MALYSEPAYPYEDKELDYYSPGLTKRELFAAMALQGMLSNPDIDFNYTHELVVDAIAAADALIKAINK